MSVLFGLLTSLPGFLNGLLAYLNKRQDTAAARSADAKDIGVSVVQAEVSRTQAAASVLQVAMGHPVFWIGWALGVLPVMLYYGSIFWVSTFPALGWEVQRAPADALEFAHQVTNWLFGIAGASSLVAGVAQAWAKRV
jgi:hypothetical protein